ncbi:hypothetical protein Ntsu_25960 [Nocardia sp. IFM 10818]
MSDEDRDQRQFILGLFVVMVVTPLLAGLTAFVGAVGVTWVLETRKRMIAARGRRHPATPRRDPLPRLAAHRPPRRGENRGPSRTGSRRSGRISH